MNKNKVFMVRVSNTVFGAEDNTIRRIKVDREGNITGHDEVQRGFYSTENMPAKGWTLDQLFKWVSRDETGRHPEHFYEIKKENSKDEFDSFFSIERLREYLGLN